MSEQVKSSPYIYPSFGAILFYTDQTFIKSFLMTFKSFTTVDGLFDLLVQRFWIQPPPKTTAAEREEWRRSKQHVIQVRFVSSTFFLRTEFEK
jgi:hypothetical protein